MKKVLCIAISLTLLITLIGCRKKDVPATGQDQVVEGSQSSSSVDDVASSDTISSEPEQAVESQDASSEESSKPNNSSKPSKSESSVPVTVIEPQKTSTSVTTFEEGKQQQQEKVEEYQKEHNIDASTAGETGEICHCGKKIWNPNKYGFANPGYPENYENSGYCTGACSIVLG